MKAFKRIVCLAALAGALLAGGSFASRAMAQDPFGPRITVTRWTLSHGRADFLRPVGLFNAANRRGSVVRGVNTMIAAIGGNRRITLGLDRTGTRMVGRNPIALASPGLSSGMSLVVAELNRGDVFRGWNYLATRFGTGNLYATVSIPEKGIVAGMELRTFQQMRDYDANSILYEAPDFGNLVVNHNLEGGRVYIGAVINGRTMYTNVTYANPMELMLSVVGQHRYKNGVLRLTVQAQLPNTFESPCWIRWAAQANSGTVIRDVFVTPVNPTRQALFKVARFEIHLKKETKGSVKISAVASSNGMRNVIVSGRRVRVPWRVFLYSIPRAPQSVGLNTFLSAGATLEDTISVQAKPDQDHGLTGVTVNRSPVFIKIWDHGVEDGDVVQIFVNGQYYTTVRMTKFGTTLRLPLAFGRHTFQVKALNQGKVGLNTASMSISGVVRGRHQQSWSLKTGRVAGMSIDVAANAR